MGRIHLGRCYVLFVKEEVEGVYLVIVCTVYRRYRINVFHAYRRGKLTYILKVCVYAIATFSSVYPL